MSGKRVKQIKKIVRKEHLRIAKETAIHINAELFALSLFKRVVVAIRLIFKIVSKK